MNLGSMIFELLFLWTMDFVCSHLGCFGFVWSCMWTSCTLDIWKRLVNFKNLKTLDSVSFCLCLNWFKLCFYCGLEWTFDFLWILNLSRCCLGFQLRFWACDLWTRAWKPWNLCNICGMSTFNLWLLDSEFRIWKMNFELWAFSFVLHCLECLDFGLNFSGHCLNFGTLFEAV